jgi:Tfp pilus assembly protein PilF
MISHSARFWFLVVLRALVAVGMCGLVLGCASDQEKWASHVEKARGYIKAGEFRSAEIELKNAVQLDPDAVDAYVLGANLFEAQ